MRLPGKRLRACIGVLVVPTFVQACAAIPDQRLDVQILKDVRSVKVARYEPPKLRKATTGSRIAGVTSGALGVLFGGIGGGVGAAVMLGMETSNGEALAEQLQLPDCGEMVMTKFVERVQAELSDWPELSVDKTNVTDDRAGSDGHAIVFRVDQVRVSDGSGLTISTDADMFAPDRNRIWRRRCVYRSSDHQRCTELSRLEADGGKLFHEEWQYAAETTVADFVAHLKGEGGDRAIAA